MRTAALGDPTSVTIPAQGRGDRSGSGLPLGGFSPVVLLAVLLLVATWFQGAFALRHWAPVAALGLAIVASAAFAGGLRIAGRPARAAVLALWGFAAWTLISALWAASPGQALEGGARTLLYATLFTLALATPFGGGQAARLGRAVVAGVAVVAAITLAQLIGDGTGEFLAGRLDAPVGYRNATACLFGVAFWPLVSTAAHRMASPPLRSGAFAAAVLVLGLAFMTEARGLLVGLAAGALVAIALGPDRLRRSWVAIAAIAGVAAGSDDLLTPYRAFADGAPESAADIAVAVETLVVLVAGAAILGFAGALLDRGLRLSDRARVAGRRVGTAAIGLMVAAGVVVALAAVGNPLSFARDRVDEFRGLETAAAGTTRLTFAGGQRSDIWRVALIEFRERPLTGVGEGNFSFRYYEERRTDRNLSTPHSLAFGLLAEKGVLGTLAFLAFLTAALTAVATRWRVAASAERWTASGLLAGAAVAFGQSLVDWLWVVPGVMGLGFLLLGLGVATLAPAAGPAPPRRLRIGGRLVAGLAASAAALGVAVLYVADTDVRRARAPDATPVERLDSARAAERLNRWSVTPRYLQAGALEELGRVGAARRELLEALDLEPESFVTRGLLGDLELRRGNRRAAAAWYRRALARNPLDSGLGELARRAEREP